MAAFRSALAKDLSVGHALRELIDGDPAHRAELVGGTNLVSETTVEPADPHSGDHIGQIMPLRSAGNLGANGGRNTVLLDPNIRMDLPSDPNSARARGRKPAV